MAAANSRLWFRLLILALGYYGLGMLTGSLPLAALPTSSAIAVAVLLRWGMRYWPAILAGGLLAGVPIGQHSSMALPMIVMLACIHTLGALLSAWMLRILGFHAALQRFRDIPLLVLSVGICMLLQAVGLAAALLDPQLVPRATMPRLILTLWSSHVFYVLLLLPLLLNITFKELKRLWQSHKSDLVLGLAVLLLELATLYYLPNNGVQYLALALLVLPLVVLIAMRIGVVGSALLVVLLSLSAIAFSVRFELPLWEAWVSCGILLLAVLLVNALQASREKSDQALRNSENKLRAVVDHAQDGIVSIDEHGKLVEFNHAAERMFGYKREDVLGKLLVETLIPPNMREAHIRGHHKYLQTGSTDILNRRLEIQALRADGTEFPVELTITSLKDQGLPLLTGFFRDLTERRKVESEIRNLAFFDALTGLPNRRLLMDRLNQAIAASVRHEKHGAVLFIDLDDFKALNDSRGHDVGDLLLVEVSKRLRQCVRNEDTVARLGGDEFVIVLEDMSLNLEQALAQTKLVAQKVLETVNQPYQLGEIEHHNSSSIGIVLFNGNFVSIDELLKRSDTAMYEAKAAGRNTLRFFDPAMQAALEKRVDMELQLRLALVQEQLRLYCQVQVDDQRRVFGAEVLLRWQHPEHGLLSPKEFVSIAEDSGLIVSIGRWVLYNACLQLKSWEGRPGLDTLQLAVNVSARQFRHSDFVDEVLKILQTTGADPSLLKLELTESVVLDNLADAVAKMNALRELGVRFSMDDFGTGYSSLAYLKRLPLTQVKIDRSFVRDIAEDASDAAIVQAILAMSNTLGLKVIAEGVETEAQFQLLQSYGCRFFQGYLFSKPLQIDEFERLLKDHDFLL